MKNQFEIDVFKNCIKRIEPSEELKTEMIQKIYMQKRTHIYKTKFSFVRRWIVIAATVLLIICIGVPVTAKVQSLLKERMSQVPQEEMEKLTNQIDAQHVETDSFNRKYSDNEEKMIIKLGAEYEQGRFPEGKLIQISKVEEVDSKRVCYLVTNGCFYLPERELTEEDILEIIDFQYTQGYALGERYQKMYADEIKVQEKQEKQSMEKIQNQGGISADRAERIGSEWMEKLYPEKQASMEHNTYLYSSSDFGQERSSDSQETIKYPNLYMSYIGTMYEFNYFYIDADTGTLAAFLHSDSSILTHEASKEETVSSIQKMLEGAKRTLSDTFGITEYEKVMATYYLTEQDINSYGTITYHFMTMDGTDYMLKYLVDTGELIEYRDTYDNEYMELKKQADEFLKDKQGDNYVEKKMYTINL